jgi:hypothetical protein
MRSYPGQASASTTLGPARRRGWLLGRIAIKDRAATPVGAGAGPLFPSRSGRERPGGRPARRRRAARSPYRSRRDELAAAIVGGDSEESVSCGGRRAAHRRSPSWRSPARARARRRRPRALRGAPVGREGGVAKLRGTGLTNPAWSTGRRSLRDRRRPSRTALRVRGGVDQEAMTDEIWAWNSDRRGRRRRVCSPGRSRWNLVQRRPEPRHRVRRARGGSCTTAAQWTSSVDLEEGARPDHQPHRR